MVFFYCRKCNGTGLKYVDIPRERKPSDRCQKCGGFGYSYITDITNLAQLDNLQKCLSDEWTISPEEAKKLEDNERNQHQFK